MPNLVRRRRGNHPPPLRPPIRRDPGTSLFYRERDIAYSLNQYAGWTHYDISHSLGISTKTISYSLRQQIWTPQKQKGRKPNIDTPARKRLITRAKQDR